jgi:putative endonuclease
MAFVSFLKRLLIRTPAELTTAARIGAAGEKAAADFAERKGWRILERNWTCRSGEIDLICLDHGTCVFIEVKTSRKLGWAAPEARVDHDKRRRLRSLAQRYRKHRFPDSPCRFDIIAVWWDNDQQQLRHYENAF